MVANRSKQGRAKLSSKEAVTDDSAIVCTCTCERDRHLFCPGPKRILALDGGGVRGAITVAFLERIEEVLTEHLQHRVHLAHWFDLIGGTSTGAIIAGALAMGYTIGDIKRFYFELAPKVFTRPFWRFAPAVAKFDARALSREIKRVVGEATLGSDELITGFCLVTKRMDTGSPWILANNSRTPYWETKTGPGGYIGNKNYVLANLVRASTAAPLYFDPEWLLIAEGERPGLFVDGAVSPHNNPSLRLFLTAVLNAYGLRWKMGPENLTIVSVGTGTHRSRVIPEEMGIGRTARLAYHALLSLMSDIETFVLTQMQYLGECLTPWFIDSELGTLANETPPHGKLFRFLRYNLTLELEWIERELGEQAEQALGRKLTEIDVIRMRSMDDPTIIEEIYKLARVAAEKQVKPEHWTGTAPTWCGGRRPSGPTRQMPRENHQAQLSFGLRVSNAINTRLSYLRSRMARFLDPSRS
jgi:hypothetical protein